MRTGFGHVNKALDDAKARSSQGFSGKLNYFNWKDGETKVLRFLTEDILTVNFYEMVLDNQGKFKDFIVAPDLNCDDEGRPQGEDWVLKYGGKCHEKGMSGPLITPKSKPRAVGIAVLREEAPREVNGKAVMGYQDALESVTVDNAEYPARWFGVVKQSLNLFWNQMSGYHQEFGTICDRDYKVTRRGAKLDTTYQIIPLREDADFDIRALQESYGYGRPADKNDPDRFLYCPQTIQEWAGYYASEDRVKHFLGAPSQASSNGGSSNGLDESRAGTTHNPAPDEAQAAPPAASDFSSLRSRLEKHT